MEMGVEDLLVSGFAIGVEKVDAFAAKVASSQCLRYSLGDVEHVSTGPRIDVGQGRQVCSWDDQSVPGRDRVDVEKDNQGVILVDDRGLSVASNDLAEDAGWVDHSDLSQLGSMVLRQLLIRYVPGYLTDHWSKAASALATSPGTATTNARR